MDVLERVRELGADAAPFDDARVDGARQTLLREIARGERVGARSVRRRWIRGSALASGVAAVAVVVGLVAWPASAPTASASAVLENAAEVTLTTTAITPAAGQYVRIQEIATYRLGWTPDTHDPNGGHWDSSASKTEATLVETRSLYVPADRSDDWVRDYDESVEVQQVSGPDAELARPLLSNSSPGIGVEVYPGGLFNEPELTRQGVYRPRPVDGLQCYYDEMPRDPAALARWASEFERLPTDSCPPPSFTEPDSFNLAPPDLRAAMFRALALTEGAELVKVDGNVATVAFPEGGESDWMNTVDIDLTTGLMVGRGNLGSDTWSSRVVVTIVDAIPATVSIPAG